jgi:hypothetical protein
MIPTLGRHCLAILACKSLQHSKRSLSSSLNRILLYERSKSRATFPRGLVGIATFNSVYWVWYTFDFLPAVNRSPIEDLDVDTTLGFLGIALSMVLQFGAVAYPLRLVSKLEYDPKAQNFTVYQHDIPLVIASHIGRTYPIGTLKLDPASLEARTLLAAQENFRGNLALKAVNERFPLLVDVQEDELKDAALFSKILTEPEQVVRIKSISPSSKEDAEKKKATRREKVATPMKRR